MILRTPRLIPEKADFRPALALRSLPDANGTHMTKMTYGEQLKHPNWQRKRLEVLEHAEFRCQRCMDAESTLHVHHKRYVKGRMAWEYEARELVALCEDCHQEMHAESDAVAYMLTHVSAGGYTQLRDVVALLAGWLRVLHRGPDGLGPVSDYVSDADPELVAGYVASLLSQGVWCNDLTVQQLYAVTDLLEDDYLQRFKALLDEARAARHARKAGANNEH
jgi:hypothetical protein